MYRNSCSLTLIQINFEEGQVQTDNLEALFCIMPLPLSLTMTEKQEKAAIMNEKGCSELEAVYQMAQRIPDRCDTLCALDEKPLGVTFAIFNMRDELDKRY